MNAVNAMDAVNARNALVAMDPVNAMNAMDAVNAVNAECMANIGQTTTQKCGDIAWCSPQFCVLENTRSSCDILVSGS